MSRENVERMRRGFEHWLATGEFLAENLHPDFVWDMSTFRGWPERQEYPGIEGARRFNADWGEVWDDWGVEIEDYIDAGEQVVVVVMRQHGRSKATGVPVEMRFGQVWTLARHGAAIRMQMYANPEEALEAAGLSEQAMSQENVSVGPGVRTTLSSISEEASQRRVLDERLFVRIPGLARGLAQLLLRLPPQSRLRRLMVARRIGRAYAAANRRDFDLILAGLDRETEYRPAPDLIAPDQDEVFFGHDGYLRMWRNWLDAFHDLRFDPEEVVDLGDTFLVTAQQRAHVPGSAMAVGKPVFQLFKVRRGLVIWQHDFSDRSAALEAAGLSE